MHRIAVFVQEMAENGGLVREWAQWSAAGEEGAVYTAAMGLRNYAERYLDMQPVTYGRVRTGESEAATPLFVGLVTAAELNVRNGPGQDFEVMYALHEEDAVEVFETVGEDDAPAGVASPNAWYRIGADEWVSGRYIWRDTGGERPPDGSLISLPVVLREEGVTG